MIAAFLIRFLLVLGLTLLPVMLASAWFREEVCFGRPTEIARLQGTYYALLVVVGSIALAIMLSLVGMA